MKFDYDAERKVVIIDGEGSVIIDKEKDVIKFAKTFWNNDDFTFEFKNHVIIVANGAFFYKLKLTVRMIKYIWMNGKTFYDMK